MVEQILEERGNRYGKFNEHARITQTIKEVMASGCSWDNCTDSQKETLEMIAHKIGRIVNGDPSYDDSWIDIIGYTQLVINEFSKPIHDDAMDAMKFTTMFAGQMNEEEESYPRNEYHENGTIAVSVLNNNRDFIVIYDNQEQPFDRKKPGLYGKKLKLQGWSQTKPTEGK